MPTTARPAPFGGRALAQRCCSRQLRNEGSTYRLAPKPLDFGFHIIIMSGRLTDAPEVRSNGTTTRATFTLAVDRQVARDGNGDRPADFFRFTTFGRSADALGEWAVKGQALEVQGHVTTSTYDKDGERRWSTDFIADRVQFGAKPRSKQPDNEPSDNHSDASNDGSADESAEYTGAEF